MWLRSVSRRSGSTRAITRSPSCSSPSAARARAPGRRRARTTSTRARCSRRPRTRSTPPSCDLAAAGRVERRLDELRQHLPVLGRDRADRRRLLERLVAGERGLHAGALGERRDPLALGVAAAAPGGARPRALALLLHQLLEALLVDAEALLGRELEREVEREAVGVVEQERLVGADALLPRLLRARDHVVEQPHALLERAVERLLLAADPHLDRVPRARAARDRRAPSARARRSANFGRKRGLDADPPALHDRAAHQPPQHVAALLVGGHDAVRDQEAHPARVVGEDPQRAVGRRTSRRTACRSAPRRASTSGRNWSVSNTDVRALHDRRQRLRPMPVSMFLRRQRRERVDRVLVVLHEHEVPVLQEALVLAAREVVLGCRTRARGRGRAPQHGPHGPVGPACQKFSERGSSTIRSRGTPIASHASIASSSGPRPSSSSPSKTVAQIFSGSNPKPSSRQLPGELRRALLEVVADREVAEHLEEREMPVACEPTLSMSTVRKHFWHVVSRLCGGASWPRKYGFSGCIPALMSSVDGSYGSARATPTAAACGRATRRTRGTAGGSRRSSWNDAV